MKGIVRSLRVMCCLFLITSAVYAQHTERKWAFGYSGTPWLRPVLTSNPMNKSLGRGFRAFSLAGEYYLSQKWSVEAGYFRTEIGYSRRTMEGLQAGVKKYFVRPDFFIQPYIAGAAQFNWGRHIEGANYDHDAYYVKNPRISFVPGIGTEIYLLSPIALVARYNFNIGINSSTTVDVKPESGEAYILKDKGLFHQLELGVKITFPFRFSDEEGEGLLNVIREGLFLD